VVKTLKILFNREGIGFKLINYPTASKHWTLYNHADALGFVSFRSYTIGVLLALPF
jgi:hypothetical protein